MNRLTNMVGALHTGDTGDPPDGAPARSEDQPNQTQIGALGKRGANMIGNVLILGLIFLSLLARRF
jgi:hypothetical protein